jgi:hypothetical protein
MQKKKHPAMGCETHQENQCQPGEGKRLPPEGRSKPKILGEAPMPTPRPVPDNFDLQAHKKPLANVQVKPATPADYARFISEIKQNNSKNRLG